MFPSKRALALSALLLKAGLLSVLILELILPYPLHHDLIQAAKAAEEITANQKEDLRVMAEAMGNPYLAEVAETEVPNHGPIPAADPTIDTDPYFLRAQNWMPRHPAVAPRFVDNGDVSGDFLYDVYDGRGFAIHWRGGAHSLRVDVPLQPLAVTTDYLVLSAQENSTIFNHQAQGIPANEKVGEGLFLITVKDFIDSSRDQAAVPIFFFPLPGNGWKGNVIAKESDDAMLLGLRSTDGDFLTIEDAELEAIVQLGKWNLLAAYGMAAKQIAMDVRSGAIKPDMKAHPAISPEAIAAITGPNRSTDQDLLRQGFASLMLSVGLKKALPPVGSTAGFGLVFTGYNFDRPEFSVFPPVGRRGALFDKAKAFKNYFAELFSIQKAHADGFIEVFLNVLKDLQPRITWVVLAIGGTSLAASILLKLTVCRQKLREIRLRDLGSARAGVGTNLREVFDVLAHVFSFQKQMPYVAGERIGNWGQDLLPLPEAMKGDNSLIRRLFKQTYEAFSFRNFRHRVSAGTLGRGFVGLLIPDVLGALIIAGFIGPYYMLIAAWLTGSEAFISQVVERLADPNFAKTAAELVLLTALAWFLGAANARSQELTSQAHERAHGELQRLLQGKVFESAAERDAFIETTERELIRRYEDSSGAPPERNILFGAGDFVRWLQNLVGAGPENTKDSKFDTVTRRGGLYHQALERARQALVSRNEALGGNDAACIEAIQILEEQLKGSSFIRRYVWDSSEKRGGWFRQNKEGRAQFIQSVRQMRMAGTEILYDGATANGKLRLGPNWAPGRSLPGRRLSAIAFQNAFFGIVKGEADALLNMNATYANGVSEKAQADLALGYENTAGVGAPPANVSTELALICNRHQANVHHQQVDFVDPRSSPFVRKQLDRAWTRACARIPAGQELTPEALQTAFNLEVAAEAGVYPELGVDQQLDTDVRYSAQSRLDAFLAAGTTQARLRTMSTEAVETAKREWGAMFYLEAYTEEVNSSQTLPATSPARVGVLQRFRQSRWGKQIPSLARIVEGAYPQEAHALGFWNMIYRKMPMYGHTWMGTVRSTKMFVPYVTAVYAFNVFMLRVPASYTNFVWNAAWFFALNAANNLLDGSLRNVGFKSQTSVWHALGHGIFYGILTNLPLGIMTYTQPDFVTAPGTCVAAMAAAVGGFMVLKNLVTPKNSNGIH